MQRVIGEPPNDPGITSLVREYWLSNQRSVLRDRLKKWRLHSLSISIAYGPDCTAARICDAWDQEYSDEIDRINATLQAPERKKVA